MTTLPVLAPASLTQGGTISTGETILFAVVAGVTVACGFGLLTAKRAVSAAVNMIGIMIGLAVLYIAGEAPFLGIAQVVVYTGAVMTLVLFVVMLVGVGGDEPVSTGSAVTTWIVGVFGLGLVVALVGAVAGWVFVCFTAMMVLQLFFVMTMMPETKGVPLEELSKSLIKEDI